MKTRELVHLRLVVMPEPTAAARPSDRASVEIYRPFFLAGMICVLTVGCLLGAVALFGIGRAESYTSAAWSPYILAHANSQLFGWVGLFVIGFALQQHAPTIAKAKLFHRLAWGSLGLMATGIALRFVAEPMVQSNREVWLPIGVFSTILQAVAVGLFVFNTTYTRHRRHEGLTWQSRFVFASLFWLMLVAAAEPFVFAGTHQADRMSSIAFVARWYPVMREAQFLGFVASMIFGVSLVKLNSCFGVKQANSTLGQVGFFLWTTGLVMRMFGWLNGFDNQFAPGSQQLFFLGGVVLAVAAVMLVLTSRIFESLSKAARSHKFVRGAFVWLLIAGAMMVWEPFHLRILGAPFSHAYTGAIRHAVTVGFISQMILGFGAHVVARMNDLEEAALPALWSAFLLLNLGNAARVGLEVASDFNRSAYLPMGFTGFVELVGLAIWAFSVARPMLIRRRQLSYA